MTFKNRKPSLELNLRRRIPFIYCRQHLMEDNLRWMTTFHRRSHLMEEKLRLKTTFDGRQPLIEDDL